MVNIVEEPTQAPTLLRMVQKPRTSRSDGGGKRYYKTTDSGNLERNSTCILTCCEIHTMAHGKGPPPPLNSVLAPGVGSLDHVKEMTNKSEGGSRGTGYL